MTGAPMISLKKADGSFPSEEEPFSMMSCESAELALAVKYWKVEFARRNEGEIGLRGDRRLNAD
jgi:hypothetical protein